MIERWGVSLTFPCEDAKRLIAVGGGGGGGGGGISCIVVAVV